MPRVTGTTEGMRHQRIDRRHQQPYERVRPRRVNRHGADSPDDNGGYEADISAVAKNEEPAQDLLTHSLPLPALPLPSIPPLPDMNDNEELKPRDLFDDGSSLTQESHPSEAETEHLFNEGESHSNIAARMDIVSSSQIPRDDQSYRSVDDIPDDLDNLSDSSMLKSSNLEPSEHGSADIVDDDESESNSRDEPLSMRDFAEDDPVDVEPNDPPTQAQSPSIKQDHRQTNIQAQRTSPNAHQDTSWNTDRKRKRISDVPTRSPKRPAILPRRIAAQAESDDDLDEDDGEDDEDVVSKSKAEEPLDSDIEERPEGTSEDQIEDPAKDEVHNIDEVEEVEEEVQDDHEREERNRHRLGAMEALKQIELTFNRLRTQLYEERAAHVENEMKLTESGQHPLLLERAKQNSQRRELRQIRAKVLLDRRKTMVASEHKANNFMTQSQFSQEKQKLRGRLLSRTSAEWFQIHREKRVLDMAVPEYGFVISDKRHVQLKQRRDFEAELSILAGIKRYIGFPAAPPISSITAKEAETDLTQMGIYKGLGLTTREVKSANVAKPVVVQPGHSNNPKPHFHHHHSAHTHHHKVANGTAASHTQPAYTHNFQSDASAATSRKNQQDRKALVETRSREDKERQPYTPLPRPTAFQPPRPELPSILRPDSVNKDKLPSLPILNGDAHHFDYQHKKPYQPLWHHTDPRAGSSSLPFNPLPPNSNFSSPKVFSPHPQPLFKMDSMVSPKKHLPSPGQYQGQGSTTPTSLFQTTRSPQARQGAPDHRTLFAPPPPPPFLREVGKHE